jgi:8-oxo-dGTP pyrophosphatase MutT (NUDIX family)
MKKNISNDVNTGAGFFIICPKNQKILLALRSTGNEPDRWCYFGGHTKKHESPLETATRETMEESQIYPDHIIKQPIYIRQENVHEGKGFKYHTFLGITDNEITPILNNEHKQHKWFTISELQHIRLHSGVREILNNINAMDTIKKYLGS